MYGESLPSGSGRGLYLKRIDTSLPEVCVIEPHVLMDSRGFFLETYHRSKYAALGITDDFVQDNHSRSSRGVLRGLHYQLRCPQAKLCRVIEGEVLDVAVDIRTGSPTFGKWASIVLSAAKHNQIYVPKGFAHGFLVLSESAQFLYKCSDFYESADERGIAWNDPELNIDWGISSPLLSNKDLRNSRLSEVPKQFLPEYGGK
jgi:dTDP-4-dehydrorhamnose 3,5-epimerase